MRIVHHDADIRPTQVARKLVGIVEKKFSVFLDFFALPGVRHDVVDNPDVRFGASPFFKTVGGCLVDAPNARVRVNFRAERKDAQQVGRADDGATCTPLVNYRQRGAVNSFVKPSGEDAEAIVHSASFFDLNDSDDDDDVEAEPYP